jgi:hypothetical protein
VVIYVLTDSQGWLASIRELGLAERIRHVEPGVLIETCSTSGDDESEEFITPVDES